MEKFFCVRPAIRIAFVGLGFLLCIVQVAGGSYILLVAVDDHFVKLGQAYLFPGLVWGSLWIVSLFISSRESITAAPPVPAPLPETVVPAQRPDTDSK